MALTREPSGRRASTIGELSSTRRPTRLTIRSMTRSRWRIVLERRRDTFEYAAALDEHVSYVLTRMSLIVGSRSSGSSGTESEDVVEDFGKQGFPLRQAERSRFLRQQLREQRTDFAFGSGTLHMRERFEIQSYRAACDGRWRAARDTDVEQSPEPGAAAGAMLGAAALRMIGYHIEASRWRPSDDAFNREVPRLHRDPRSVW